MPAVQPIFSQGTVYAPDREWAELMITEMSLFPAGRFSDLTDRISQAPKYLRDVGLAQSGEEQHETRDRPKPPQLGPAMAVFIDAPHVAAILNDHVIEPIPISGG